MKVPDQKTGFTYADMSQLATALNIIQSDISAVKQQMTSLQSSVSTQIKAISDITKSLQTVSPK